MSFGWQSQHQNTPLEPKKRIEKKIQLEIEKS
jgi:hypothetical protein